MSDLISEKKKNLRQEILRIRNDIPKDAHLEKSRRITEGVLTLPAFLGAKIIASFSSIRGEVDMHFINTRMASLKKQLALPRVNADHMTLSFFAVDDLETLVPGAFGILEPNPAHHAEIPYEALDCILTPGAAFDVSGYRLGYGGGYYDRLFSRLSAGIPKIAPAFDCQRVPEVPRDVFDTPVNYLVTEYKIYSF
ncbi:MAG: 5-formyltetrahydrofolate cyclo-ligase [Clostridiales bacterium]|jgi:5-formyltetrahydrofolate cyclo-ligase|nr:5-formyltetrahydrofolate cyclo-ligase [Clostridiales bacterium]